MLSHSQTVPISHLEVKCLTIPADSLESDGTLEWDRTTIVLVQASGGGKQGLGYTYADPATATLIHGTLAPHVKGMDGMSPPAVHMAMWRRLRNLGRPGVCSTAISAIDCALWDLKARLLDISLVTVLGRIREAALRLGESGYSAREDEDWPRSRARCGARTHCPQRHWPPS